MAEMTEVSAVELPKRLYFVVHYHPEFGRAVPLMMPFPPVGFGMPVFSEQELAEEFAASPNVDVPVVIRERAIEHFIRAGELPIDIAREHDTENEYFYMVDPRPMHEWEGVEDMGFLVPMADAAEMLREELGI